MGEQLGLQGLIIPEEYGGSGYSFVELGVVLEEMGRALLCAPYFSTVVLAANTLLQSGDDAGQEGLPAGHRLGRDDRHARPSPSRRASGTRAASPCSATQSGDGWTLDGTKSFVLDGTHRRPDPGRRARTGNGVSLFAVDADAAGLTRTALSTMDQTRKQAKLEFVDTPARLLGTEGGGLADAVDGARPGRGRSGRRAGRRRPEGARDGRRVRQGPRAVRPSDRFVPGHQAQVRRHARSRSSRPSPLRTTACGARPR